MAKELIADIINGSPVTVIAVLSHRENLIVALYRQFKLRFKIYPDEREGRGLG